MPYTYSWNDAASQSNSIATGLLAGTYIATVIDSSGCQDSDTITITQPSDLVLTIMDSATAICGSPNSFAVVFVSGVVSPYTYLWNDPALQTNDTAAGLSSGIYKIKVTDAAGCVDSAQANVVDFSAPVVTLTGSVNIACYGDNTGSASISATGGNPPYTYLWSPSGGSTTTASYLIAGNYTVVVTDNNGCKGIKSVLITQPLQFTASITDSVYVLCFGDSTGSATVTPQGGVPPYTYIWSNGDNSSIADSLTAGNYTVTVIDANSCPANGDPVISSCFEITSILVDACAPGGGFEGENEMVRFQVGPSALNTSTIFIDWPSNAWLGICQNAVTAGIVDSINANITSGGNVLEPVGGVLPAGAIVMIATSTNFDWATHDWSGLDYTIYLIFQCSGNTVGHFKNGDCSCPTCNNNRTLIIDFGVGCSDTVSYIPCVLDSVSGTSNGDEVEYDADGNPTYQNIGCLPPIILLSPPMGISIIQPASAVTASVTSLTNINCFGDSTGSATANGSGGTSPFTYLWSNGATQSAISNLQSAIYTISVKDNNGCTDTAQITITQPAADLSVSIISTTNIICNGDSTGSATLNATGGSLPYTYLWNDPLSQNSTTAINLQSGIYWAKVTDANGCNDSVSVPLIQPATLAPAITNVIDENCNSSDGQAVALATGGSSPYTYSWNDPSSQTNSNATGLTAGTYTVIVTDSNSCIDSSTIVINSLSGPSVIITNSINNLCSGDSNGSAVAYASNGTPLYTYLWNDPASQSNDSVSLLVAGVYKVLVTDANGCIDSAIVTISTPAALSVLMDSANITCFGNADGSTSVTPSGGTSPYAYLWDDPLTQTDSIADNLSTGLYRVTITDNNGCFVIDSISITEPPVFSITHDSIDVLCNGNADGMAIVIASGGVPPYTYLWNDPLSQTNDTASSLSGGIYKIVVTDNNGCGDSATVTLTEPAAIILAVSKINSTCGNADGMASVSVTGGVTPYSYLWNDPASQTNDTAIALAAGVYTAVVTDSNGCINSAIININDIGAPTISITDSAHNNCNGDSSGFATITPSGGFPPFTYLWGDPDAQTDSTATGLKAGTFPVTVTDSGGCIAVTTFTITQPPLLSTTITGLTNVLCNGDSSGSATVTSAGGTPPYFYLWSNGSTTSNIQLLTSNNYTVTVTDSNGCAEVDSVTITQPQVLSFTGTPVNSTCGNPNGSACVTISGGVVPYSVAWDDPSNTMGVCADSIPAGTYNPVVTDSNGCTYSFPVIINNIAGPVLDTIVATDLLCAGDSSGTASVTASGGTPPFTYQWNNGSALLTATGLDAGSYSIVITDGNACTASDSVSITQPSVLTAALTAQGTCAGTSNGSVYVTAMEGTPPYSFLWNTSQTNDSIFGLAAGNYSVVVTDSNGCTGNFSVSVSGTGGPTIALLSVIDVSCNDSCDGSATIAATGGTPPYVYAWSNLQSTSTATGLCDGVYTVLVTDFKGCSDSTSAVINEPAPLSVTALEGNDILCAGKCTQFASVIAVGGTPPYAYQWNTNPVQTDGTAVNLCKGNYSVIISDSKNCQSSASLVITEDDLLMQVTSTRTDESCPENKDGSIALELLGGTSPYTYLWSNGATQSAISNLQSAIYTVTITDGLGCTITRSDTLLSGIAGCLNIPTSFSPNGDDYNDNWVIRGIEKYPDATLEVFNRWGSKLYSSKENPMPWDGKYNGNKVSAATYYFILVIGSGIEPVTGTVTVIW